MGIAEENAIRRRARELAAQAAGAADETGWFETLYAEAETGGSVVPWADGDTNPHLIEWATMPASPERRAGAGKKALVVEAYTVQPLYGPVRGRALAALHGPVAPGGTLLVIARATNDPEPERDPGMMPWPLTRRELELSGGPLRPASVEQFFDDEDPPKLRWRAEFRRD